MCVGLGFKENGDRDGSICVSVCVVCCGVVWCGVVVLKSARECFSFGGSFPASLTLSDKKRDGNHEKLGTDLFIIAMRCASIFRLKCLLKNSN